MAQAAIRVAGFTVMVALISTFAVGQPPDEVYDFDGVADADPQPADPTDWMTQENWSDGGADPLPPFGPPIPDFGTRVEIQVSTFGVDAPEIGPGDVAEAYEVRIGRSGGAGLLTMSGGTLETVDSCLAPPFSCDRRLRVGAANVSTDEERMPGTFNLSAGTVTTDTLWIGSGSHGEMNMSGGIVNSRGILYFDWTGHPSEPLTPLDTMSVLNMTGGTINVGTSFVSPLRMYRKSSLNLDGGEIHINGAAELGTQKQQNELLDPIAEIPSVTVSITDGLLAAADYLQVRGSVVLDGGILRALSFLEADSTGTIEINEGGTLQFSNAQESIADVQNLISSGFLTTSSPQGTAGFVIEVVDVNGTDFTQIAFAAGLRGDFDIDGDVDGADLLDWQRGFSAGFSDTDLDDWQENFGAVAPLAAVQAVPEPGSLVLAVLGGLTLLMRYKRR